MTPKSFYKTLFVLILVAIFASLAGSIPFWKKELAISKEISKREVILESYTLKEQTLGNLTISYEKIKKDMDKIYASLPDSKNTTKLMNDLNTLASSKGVGLVDFRYKSTDKKITPAKEGLDVGSAEKGAATTKDLTLLQTEKDTSGDFHKFPIEIVAKGSYTKILEFTREMEKINRLIVVEKIAFVKEQSETDPSTDYVSAKINIAAYLKK